MFKIQSSNKRKVGVYEDLREGSQPGSRFYFLVAVSTLIASFGLVMNSTAVIIGAMLVAPLMTPILGLGLGLARVEATFIRLALRAEVTGIVIAVGAGALFGLSLPYIETTPEMLSRTTPNLLDLLVAVFAGSAGAYALVDEKLSPALPGVAISTAIVPPLANCGLSLSLGAYQGAWGSLSPLLHQLPVDPSRFRSRLLPRRNGPRTQAARESDDRSPIRYRRCRLCSHRGYSERRDSQNVRAPAFG